MPDQSRGWSEIQITRWRRGEVIRAQLNATITANGTDRRGFGLHIL